MDLDFPTVDMNFFQIGSKEFFFQAKINENVSRLVFPLWG